MQIETQAKEPSGKALTNFDAKLPKPQSDLARESLKDPYRFDFLGLTDAAQERDVEDALMSHVTRFLLELGAGFSVSNGHSALALKRHAAGHAVGKNRPRPAQRVRDGRARHRDQLHVVGRH